MKISSRPPEDGDSIAIGSGSITLHLTDHQMELIAALMGNCRLGQGTYSQAAFEILEMIEDEFGSDYVADASDLVNLEVTIEDHTGSVVFSTKSGAFYPTLEV